MREQAAKVNMEEFIKIPIEFISLDMKIYPPSFLPIHLTTSVSSEIHWNYDRDFESHQRAFSKLPEAEKLKFIQILMKTLGRNYKIGNDGYIYDYGPFNLNIYEYDNENNLKLSGKNKIPCILINENLNQVISNKRDLKNPQFQMSNHLYKSIPEYRYHFHARRITTNTVMLLLKCALK